MCITVNATKGVVLMGRRSGNVSFMPNAYVFPGGNVELNDEKLPTTLTNLTTCSAPADFGRRVAAVRELFEECGLLPVVNCHNQRWVRHLLRTQGWQIVTGYIQPQDPLHFPFSRVHIPQAY